MLSTGCEEQGEHLEGMNRGPGGTAISRTSQSTTQERDLLEDEVRCEVWDPAASDYARWSCGLGEVCALTVGEGGASSMVECIPAPQCAGEVVSCGCLVEEGINPCPGSARQCEGVIGKSVTCSSRE